MGRAKQQSNPTEIAGNWVPAGDDAAGWIYNQQTYDWKGRPLVTTNQDGTQKYASYGGCGCAGGEVVTLTDEVGRQQKVYSDVVGRQWKTEVLNWNGTVYSTTTNTFNARDQVTLVRQWTGAENGGGAYQDTTMSYDGYGRLKTKHVPEQSAGAATVFAYNTDDTIQSVTDARGASATYGYNNRHLVTSLNYSAPGGITPTSNVTFGYDAAGNRTSMTDETGSTSYAFDQLSRMSSETHTLTGVGAKTISYQYNLADQLASITDPLNVTINYGHDQAGRLSGITGSGASAVPTFASNMQYRAWGAVKHLNYGNGRTLDATYNSRLQAVSFQIPAVISRTYEYHADNRLRFSSDQLDHRFDRFYSYDHAARIKEAFSGAEARFEAPTDDRPYRQTYAYDAMNHLTVRTSKVWLVNMSSSDSYTNNRHDPVGSLWQYDADGNLLMMPGTGYEYDAAGRAVNLTTATPTNLAYDGDGRQVKSAETVYDPQTETETTTTKYYVRSTVLGGKVLTEIEPESGYTRTFVYAGDAVVATQESWGSPFVSWEHRDPSNATYRTTMVGTQPGDHAELDPMGANAGISNGAYQSIPEEGSLAPYPSFSKGSDLGTTYSWDGIRMPADEFFQTVNTLLHGRFGIAQALMRGTRIIGTPPSPLPDVHDELAGITIPTYGTDPMAMGLLFAEPQNPPRLVTKHELGALRTEIEKALQSDKCRAFIDKLISYNTGKPYRSADHFLDYLDATAASAEGGIFFRSPGGGGITRARKEDYPKILIPGLRPELNVLTDAATLMHELIHSLTEGSDDQLDRDLLKLGITPIGRDGKPMPFPTGVRDGKPFNDWSAYWDTALTNACFPKL